MAEAAFAVGDRVAWSHVVATDHAAGSVLKSDVLGAKDPDDHQFGTVKSVANDEGTWFEVELDGGQSMVLTEDELVKIVDSPSERVDEAS